MPIVPACEFSRCIANNKIASGPGHKTDRSRPFDPLPGGKDEAIKPALVLAPYPCSIQCVDEHPQAVIDPVRCQGYGTCVSECPGKAISLKHFTDEQLIAKTAALFARG